MRIEIDPAADAAAIEWAPRARGESQVVARPGARGVRLYFDAAGDVVGLEVLGWSRRAETPQEVRVVVRLRQGRARSRTTTRSPRALSEASGVATDDRHRPLHEGLPMLTLAEAAGADRAGALLGIPRDGRWPPARPQDRARLVDRTRMG